MKKLATVIVAVLLAVGGVYAHRWMRQRSLDEQFFQIGLRCPRGQLILKNRGDKGVTVAVSEPHLHEDNLLGAGAPRMPPVILTSAAMQLILPQNELRVRYSGDCPGTTIVGGGLAERRAACRLNFLLTVGEKSEPVFCYIE